MSFDAIVSWPSRVTPCAETSVDCRLFEELWIPLVHNSFTIGAKVYLHLCGPNGKHLLHAAKMQPDLAKLPSNNTEKRQLLDTLVTLIDSNHHNAYIMPAPAAKPENVDTDRQTLFCQQISADPLPVKAACKAPVTPPAAAELPVSAATYRKLVFDGSSIDSAGVSALIRVYLDGYIRFSPFIKYFPVPTQFNLPAEFRPTTERHPCWEASKLADQWLKRRDLAFEVCLQASALQQVVNARATEVERDRQEEHRQNKKKFVAHEVSMDLRTAADKVAALLQAAMQANKKNGCHPQSVVTLSTMFKDLRAGKQDAEVHRSKNDPTPRRLQAGSLEGWMCIACSGDVDAIVQDLYV